MSKTRRNLLKYKSFVEHRDVIWTEYHQFELDFYTSCLREYPRKETRQELRQDNDWRHLRFVNFYCYFI